MARLRGFLRARVDLIIALFGAGLFTFWLMLLLGIAHADVPVVPAWGYWKCLAVVTIGDGLRRSYILLTRGLRGVA